MSKLIQRLLIFFIGLPLVLFIVYLPAYNHLALNIAIVIVCFISSLEAYNIMKSNSEMQSKFLVIFLSTCISISSLICSLTGIDYLLTTFVFICAFLILLTKEVFSANKSNLPSEQLFQDSNKKITSSLFVLVYGGYLLTFLSRMSVLKNSTPYLLVFLMMVFICDSFAWFFGICFGKNNRGFFKASPNKSLIGFFGGILGSILSGILGYYLWPEVFSGSIIKMIILGFIVAISAIIGDLAESVLKRSAKIKDSGAIIPGRGGILDSIDSILMAVPFYYFIIIAMFE
ncbi:MAG: CDP-archaeol synthase [Spirochaetaceae bacterium]|nr:CDP-archaeol synthase [Spirochaetaceae bacterium]